MFFNPGSAAPCRDCAFEGTAVKRKDTARFSAQMRAKRAWIEPRLRMNMRCARQYGAARIWGNVQAYIEKRRDLKMRRNGLWMFLRINKRRIRQTEIARNPKYASSRGKNVGEGFENSSERAVLREKVQRCVATLRITCAQKTSGTAGSAPNPTLADSADKQAPHEAARRCA